MNTRCFAKKSMALLLIVLMLFSLLPTTALAKEQESGSAYPIVMVHGLLGWGAEDRVNAILPYWGTASGDMVSYLRSMGNEVYAASVGPFSSVHDRCCELFAQLTGTRVDYGQAHADSCTAEYADGGYALTHQRYGRDYTNNAKIKNWGPIYNAAGQVTGWYDNKINMVGHSFGPPTILEFIHLLAEGDAQEQAWGKQQAALYGGDWHDYISPLFWGDYHGEYLVHSVTSLVGALNGTTFISSNEDIFPYIARLFALLGNSIGVSNLASFYDCQLEQFGLSRVPGATMDAKFSFLAQKGFLYGHDQAFYDLTTEACNERKQGWDTYDNIYYFSYACNCCCQSGDVWLPNSDMFAPLAALAKPMGSYTNPDESILSVDGSVYGCVDEAWLPHDLQVNTISARYPFGAAHQDYDADNIRAGIWNVHADLSDSHFALIGTSTHPDPSGLRALYKGIADDIARTVSMPSPQPAPTFLQRLFCAAVQIVRYPLRFVHFHR